MMDKKRPYIVALLALMFVPLALFGAQAMPLPTLPSVALPNSEFVTNITLNVDYARLENLTFSLELNASASNSLSIAVGTAAGDSLALDDADFEWGYDCGTLTIDRGDFKPQWNRLRIVKRGVGDVEVNASYSREYTKLFIRLR